MGAESWTYTFTPTVEGPLNVQTRAADDSSNLETPGSGVFFTVGDGPADTTPPTVTDTSPVDGASAVPVGQTLSVTFDEDVAAGSVSWSLSGPSGAVPGSTSYAAASQTASFDPDDALDAQTTYTVTVEGARDPSGNVMEPLSWSFTTGEADTTPPTVTERSPADAAVDVALDAVLTATFDEDVVADSPSWTVSGNGSPIAGSTSYNATTRTASFQPDTKLGAATTYTRHHHWGARLLRKHHRPRLMVVHDRRHGPGAFDDLRRRDSCWRGGPGHLLGGAGCEVRRGRAGVHHRGAVLQGVGEHGDACGESVGFLGDAVGVGDVHR